MDNQLYEKTTRRYDAKHTHSYDPLFLLALTFDWLQHHALLSGAHAQNGGLRRVYYGAELLDAEHTEV